MQCTILMTEPRKRKSKGRKVTASVTFRFDPLVKLSLGEIAGLSERSENQQAEFSLKIAYLHAKGLNIYGMSDIQISQKFDEMTAHLQEINNDD